jgi:DNA-binding response OmpR family regulator
MRLLLVEDEEKVAAFIVRGLEAERFAVDVAADGGSAIELSNAYQYDLVILDLMLPGVSGTEVLRRIRRNNSQVPVVREPDVRAAAAFWRVYLPRPQTLS